jgi:hypothetical protein
VHRLSPSVLSSLAPLLQDRELTLFDGTRLVNSERFAALMVRAAK